MNKFKTSFVAGYKQDQAEEKEQKKLRKKYKVNEDKDNVVIVEKTGLAKFTVSTFIRLVKFVATVIILVLAGIGLYSLLTSSIRSELITAWKEVYSQLTM